MPVTDYFEDEDIRKARVAAAGKVADESTKGEYNLAAAQVQARGHVEAAEATKLGELKKQRELLAVGSQVAADESLGDIGKSYGGGQFDLGAIQKAQEKLQGAGNVRGFEGVGAEAGPVQVIRRMKSTYAAGAPGEEFSSFQRAAQALNRYYGQGEYVSPEVAKAEAMSLRDPLKAAQALATNKQIAEDLTRGELMKDYKVLNKETGKYELHPIAESFVRSAGVMHPNDVPKALEKIRPLIEQEHKIQLLNDPEKGKTLRAEIGQRYLTSIGKKPEDLVEGTPEKKIYESIKTGPATPQNYQAVWAPFLAPPTAAATPAATPVPGTAAPTPVPGTAAPTPVPGTAAPTPVPGTAAPTAGPTADLTGVQPARRVEFTGPAATPYSPYTGEVAREPSLGEQLSTIVRPVGKKIFGSPEDWQRASQAWEEEKRQNLTPQELQASLATLQRKKRQEEIADQLGAALESFSLAGP